jgi:putative ABC transport system permease protein
MESVIDQINTVMGTINTALSVIAGISLLVGGIGVMNIMLVSVTERTREIGTRKALGATNANIRIQFIVESTIICLIGGFFGVLLGGVLGYFGSSLIGIGSITLAVGFSMGIGVFFGYYPANKAAKLDPIEALRYE